MSKSHPQLPLYTVTIQDYNINDPLASDCTISLITRDKDFAQQTAVDIADSLMTSDNEDLTKYEPNEPKYIVRHEIYNGSENYVVESRVNPRQKRFYVVKVQQLENDVLHL